jgi:hypothetical protein
MHEVMVVGNLGVLVKNAALFRLRHVWLEGEHPVAPGHAKQVVQAFERLLVHGLVVGSTFEGAQNALDQVDQHLLRRTNDQATERGAADRDEFRRMDQRTDVAALHREAAQYGADHDNDANDNNHESVNSK